LCAAVGAPAARADEVLEAVGLVSLRDERLGTLSRGADRRLGLACALLPDPHTLVLDQPTRGLPPREHRWLHALLRAHADQGGTVLCTTADPKEAARIGDHVVTLDEGRVVADQDGAEFSRTRLRPRVAVRSPHAARLSALLSKEARAARRSVEVVWEGGNRLCVYGSTCADVGEIAFRHGIVVHQLADEVGDMGPGAGDDRPTAPTTPTGHTPPTGHTAHTDPPPPPPPTPPPPRPPPPNPPPPPPRPPVPPPPPPPPNPRRPPPPPSPRPPATSSRPPPPPLTPPPPRPPPRLPPTRPPGPTPPPPLTPNPCRPPPPLTANPCRPPPPLTANPCRPSPPPPPVTVNPCPR